MTVRPLLVVGSLLLLHVAAPPPFHNHPPQKKCMKTVKKEEVDCQPHNTVSRVMKEVAERKEHVRCLT